MDRTVIAERNVVRVDIMVPPLNSIHETIQHYQWTYLYTCACDRPYQAGPTFFMQTWRLLRMMSVGRYCSPLLTDT
jgi:hypothetical protein